MNDDYLKKYTSEAAAAEVAQDHERLVAAFEGAAEAARVHGDQKRVAVFERLAKYVKDRGPAHFAPRDALQICGFCGEGEPAVSSARTYICATCIADEALRPDIAEEAICSFCYAERSVARVRLDKRMCTTCLAFATGAVARKEEPKNEESSQE